MSYDKLIIFIKASSNGIQYQPQVKGLLQPSVKIHNIHLDRSSQNHVNYKTDKYCIIICILHYYIPLNDTSFKLSVFWPFDTESRINELRFSDSVSLSYKMRLTLVTCFCGNVMLSKFQARNKRRKA